jgi:hypothetical protein
MQNISITFQVKRDNAKMMGTGGGKEANPSVEGLNGDNCFQTEETVVDQLHAQLPTCVLPADTPSLSSVRDENRNTYTGL